MGFGEGRGGVSMRWVCLVVLLLLFGLCVGAFVRGTVVSVVGIC